jgi:hypothetical protein
VVTGNSSGNLFTQPSNQSRAGRCLEGPAEKWSQALREWRPFRSRTRPPTRSLLARSNQADLPTGERVYLLSGRNYSDAQDHDGSASVAARVRQLSCKSLPSNGGSMASETFKKRQKESARRERQQKKAARRMERRNEKARNEIGISPPNTNGGKPVSGSGPTIL